MTSQRTVLILGANSDVARQMLRRYVQQGCYVMACSRNLVALEDFATQQGLDRGRVSILPFDATAFDTHQDFYARLPHKPNIVVYAAGFLKDNQEALRDWKGSFEMMKVHYCGAVSILNIIATDNNPALERIIGLSSLSGVRGRKSNFIYGSTKSAFTQYLAGLRQYLFARGVIVNVVVAGYIRSKMTAGLPLPESLLLEPDYIAAASITSTRRFIIVPAFRWKLIYLILKILPETLVARLP